MTLVRPDLSGLSVGATIAPPVFDAVVQPTGGSITADDTHLGSVGTRSAKLVYAAGTNATGYLEIQLTCPSGAAAQFEIDMDAAPAAIDRAFALVNTAGAAAVGIYVSTAGKLVVQNASGGALAANPTYPTFPVGTRWLVDVIAIPGASTSTGRIAFRITNAETGVELMSYDNSTNNVGTTVINRARFGRYTGVNQAWTSWIANPAMADVVTGFIAAPAGASGTVVGTIATASGFTPAPVIEGETAISGGGPGTATAQVAAPTVTAGARVSAVRALATGGAGTPAVSGTSSSGAVVSAVRATATAATGVPVVTATRIATVAAVVATASATTRPPTVASSGTAAVTAVKAAASAVAYAPTVASSGTASVAAVRATAAAVAHAPTVSATRAVVIVSVVATATAAVHTPQVSAGTSPDEHPYALTLSLGPRRDPFAVTAPRRHL